MTQHLTKSDFLEKIFNFEAKKEWEFQGERPCIIDFYADWCGPCKMIAPILDELSEEYKDKVDIFKIDTEKEQELASVFGVSSIPSMLFVPLRNKPQMAVGAQPKDSIIKVIEDVLDVKN